MLGYLHHFTVDHADRGGGSASPLASRSFSHLTSDLVVGRRGVDMVEATMAVDAATPDAAVEPGMLHPSAMGMELPPTRVAVGQAHHSPHRSRRHHQSPQHQQDLSCLVRPVTHRILVRNPFARQRFSLSSTPPTTTCRRRSIAAKRMSNMFRDDLSSSDALPRCGVHREPSGRADAHAICASDADRLRAASSAGVSTLQYV